jgi:hypothetical protein
LRISRKFNRWKEVPEFAMFFVFNLQPVSQAERHPLLSTQAKLKFSNRSGAQTGAQLPMWVGILQIPKGASVSSAPH